MVFAPLLQSIDTGGMRTVTVSFGQFEVLEDSPSGKPPLPRRGKADSLPRPKSRPGSPSPVNDTPEPSAESSGIAEELEAEAASTAATVSTAPAAGPGSEAGTSQPPIALSDPAEGHGEAGPALSPPRPLAEIQPLYPRSARRLGLEGTVRILVSLDQNGKVISARVVSSSGYGMLDESALKAIRAAFFEPAKEAGRPVAYNGIIPIRFSLVDEPLKR